MSSTGVLVLVTLLATAAAGVVEAAFLLSASAPVPQALVEKLS
jgi:hypothetical protein